MYIADNRTREHFLAANAAQNRESLRSALMLNFECCDEL